MWSSIWSLCWLFQFLPLTISPVLWLWDTLFYFHNALVVTIWQNFLDKLDHFEGRFEKENVSTKKRLAFHSQIMFDVHFFIIFLPQKNEGETFPLILNVLWVGCTWILFYMMHFGPVSDILGANDKINPLEISIISLFFLDENITLCAFSPFWGCDGQAQWRWCSLGGCMIHCIGCREGAGRVAGINQGKWGGDGVGREVVT